MATVTTTDQPVPPVAAAIARHDDLLSRRARGEPVTRDALRESAAQIEDAKVDEENEARQAVISRSEAEKRRNAELLDDAEAQTLVLQARIAEYLSCLGIADAKRSDLDRELDRCNALAGDIGILLDRGRAFNHHVREVEPASNGELAKLPPGERPAVRNVGLNDFVVRYFRAFLAPLSQKMTRTMNPLTLNAEVFTRGAEEIVRMTAGKWAPPVAPTE